jgi:hypothetical protein
MIWILPIVIKQPAQTSSLVWGMLLFRSPGGTDVYEL